jgi:hypothetical protein
VAKESALKVLEMTAGRCRRCRRRCLDCGMDRWLRWIRRRCLCVCVSGDERRAKYASDLLRGDWRKGIVVAKRVAVGTAFAEAEIAPHCDSYVAVNDPGDSGGDGIGPVLDVIFGQMLGLYCSVAHELKPDSPSPVALSTAWCRSSGFTRGMMSRSSAAFGEARQGVAAGITSVCSAHPWVIRAAAEQAAADGSLLLVEATSNQVNQFGGYTGMRPAEFPQLRAGACWAAGVGCGEADSWRRSSGAESLAQIAGGGGDGSCRDDGCGVCARGFYKIHLDASMACADDPHRLSDEVVAERAARLCKAAETACGEGDRPVYVIGTEVPVPGGATHSVTELEATSVDGGGAYAGGAQAKVLRSRGWVRCGRV